jgi:hypothetical protein
MAVDWHKRSGKSHLDGISRSLARRGLDLLDITGVTAVGEYKHSSRSVIDGVIRNRVEEGLGSDKYKKICRKRTVLENIHYCQSGQTPQLSHLTPLFFLIVGHDFKVSPV